MSCVFMLTALFVVALPTAYSQSCEFTDGAGMVRNRTCTFGCCAELLQGEKNDVCCGPERKFHSGEIAGIVLGSITGFLVIIGSVYLVVRRVYMKRQEPMVSSNSIWPFKYPNLPSVADRLPSQRVGIYYPKFGFPTLYEDPTASPMTTRIYNPSDLINKNILTPKNLHTGYPAFQAMSPPNYTKFSTILKNHK